MTPRPPMDLESVTARHVAVHVSEGLRNLRSSLQPLQASRLYRDSQIARNLRAAIKEVELANRAAELWWEDARDRHAQLDVTDAAAGGG